PTGFRLLRLLRHSPDRRIARRCDRQVFLRDDHLARHARRLVRRSTARTGSAHKGPSQRKKWKRTISRRFLAAATCGSRQEIWQRCEHCSARWVEHVATAEAAPKGLILPTNCRDPSQTVHYLVHYWSLRPCRASQGVTC